MLKFVGDIMVQFQGDGLLSLVVINGNNQQQMCGVVCVQGDIFDNVDFKMLVGNGYLVIIIMLEEGECYQGVVGLEGDILVVCLEDYFLCFEQLLMCLFICIGDVDGKLVVGGMLFQVMLVQNVQVEDFDYLVMLMEIIKSEELLMLLVNDVLWCLYYEEEVIFYDL